MQDLLKKIIEMDEEARRIEQQAKLEKIRSEEEVEKLREQIYNDYISRARDRIEKNTAVQQERADAYLKEYEERAQAARQAMRGLYGENKDKWVDEIVRRSLS